MNNLKEFFENKNYTLFELMRFISLVEKNALTEGKLKAEAILNPSLKALSSDFTVDSYDAKENIIYIKTSAFNVFGYNSILPNHFIEDLQLATSANSTILRFLEIFQNRILSLAYAVWKYANLPFNVEQASKNPIKEIFSIDQSKTRHFNNSIEEIVSAISSSKSYISIDSLNSILKIAFKHIELSFSEIKPAKRLLDIKLQTTIGTNGNDNILGHSAYVGRYYVDSNAIICLKGCVATLDDMELFLSSENDIVLLKYIVSLIKNNFMKLEIDFIIKEKVLELDQLGSKAIKNKLGVKQIGNRRKEELKISLYL